MAVERDRHGKYRARVKLRGKERFLGGGYATKREARLVELDFQIAQLQKYRDDLAAYRVSADSQVPFDKTLAKVAQ